MNLHDFWCSVQNYIYAAGGAVAVMIALLLFFGKRWIDNLASRSLARQKKELDEQLEKLKAANNRVNHIMVSLYDEEQRAAKEISGLLKVYVEKVCGHAMVYDHCSIKEITHFNIQCFDHMTRLLDVMRKNCIFIDDKLYRRVEILVDNTTNILHALAIDNNDGLNEDGVNTFTRKIQGDVKLHVDRLISELDEIVKAMRSHIESKKREYLEI